MRTVVIGSGASGISSALMLARYGHQVTLLEAGRGIAPLLRGFARDGLQFDTGFHHAGELGPGGILRRYLNFTGIGPRLKYAPMRQDCCELFRFAGNGLNEDICLPQGLRENAAALAARWPEQAADIHAFFEKVEQAYQHSPFIDPRKMSTETFTIPSGQKLSEQLPQDAFPGRLHSLLTSRAVYYGTPPSRSMFEEFALVTHAMLEGVHGIAGGGAALARAFETALDEAGIEVRCGSAAQKINIKDGAAASVSTDHEEFDCDCCIHTGNPAQLPALLPAGSLRLAMTRHLLSLDETGKFFMLLCVSKSDFLSGRSLMLCMPDDIEEAWSAQDFRNSWLHVSAGTPDEDGRYPITIVTQIRQPAGDKSESRPAGYESWKQNFSQALLEHVVRHVPELSDLQALGSTGEYAMREWVYGSSGSIYGAMHSWDQLPIPPFTRVKGLLLAGQNILLPGLLGTFISAAVACGSIVGYKRLFKDLACANAE